MAWVVDTCVLIDVALPDPEFGLSSARFLTDRVSEGLAVCPLTFVELAPTFRGDVNSQQEFLTAVGADFDEPWTWGVGATAPTLSLARRRLRPTSGVVAYTLPLPSPLPLPDRLTATRRLHVCSPGRAAQTWKKPRLPQHAESRRTGKGKGEGKGKD